MKMVNCTFASKWIYNRCENFISEETTQKIKICTKDDVMDGALLEDIDAEML
jgi:hypothetical protein